jgi:hypothetical protein
MAWREVARPWSQVATPANSTRTSLTIRTAFQAADWSAKVKVEMFQKPVMIKSA